MIEVNGEKINLKDQITVSELLKKCNFTYHSLIVKIDGEIVPEKKFKTFRVPDGADVKVIHMMTGG